MKTLTPALKPNLSDRPDISVNTDVATMKDSMGQPIRHSLHATDPNSMLSLRPDDMASLLIRQLVCAHHLLMDPLFYSCMTVSGLDNNDPGENDSTSKPKEASEGACHECSTGLPTSYPYAAMSASTLQWLVDSYYHQQNPPLMKTDVFLAPAIDDNESVATTVTSLAPSTSWAPTPCLSPVTSPSDFLCNHEPLFDGIQDLQQPTDDSLSDNESDAVKFEQQNDVQNTSDNTTTLDWDDFGDDDLFSTLPTPSQSASEVNSVVDEDDEDPLEEQNEQEAPEDDDIFTSDTDDSTTYGIRPRTLKRKARHQEPTKPPQNLYLRLPDRYFENKPEKSKRSVAKRRTKKYPGRRPRARVLAPTALSVDHDKDGQYTVFEKLTLAGIDWCRYCGTTEGVNWRPGPWGKRTLCNKHGCDYKGYGIASRMPRLDLSAFSSERLQDRRRPVVQQFCAVCQLPDSVPENQLIACEGGCSRAYHQSCKSLIITNDCLDQQLWCCNALCLENLKRNKVGPYEAHPYAIGKTHANSR